MMSCSRSLAASLLLCLSLGVGAAEHQVTVDDNFFSPQHLTITAGDTVTWTNQGSNAHNVIEDNGAFRCAQGCDPTTAGVAGLETYHEPENDPGDPSSADWSFSLDFNEPGEIGYYCEVHGSPGVGMFGTITVEEAQNGGDFEINFGLTGSWFNPETDGQGFLVDVVLSQMNVVVYWFTYDHDEIGGPEQTRWMIASGSFAEGDNTTVLEVFQVTGGLFDDPAPTETQTIGSAELIFEDCTTGSLSYDLDFDGDEQNNVTGTIPIERLSPDVMCEMLDEDGGAG